MSQISSVVRHRLQIRGHEWLLDFQEKKMIVYLFLPSAVDERNSLG